VNEAALDMVALTVIEVVCSQLALGLAACEHVIEGDEHGMADGERRATFVTARSDATKFSCQIRSGQVA
jgi:hypothetical protein